MTRKRITSKTFHAINRTIKEQVAAGKYRAEKVAKQHGVGTSTVRSIKSAKTWPGYQRAKADNLGRRAARSKTDAPVTAKAPGWARANASRPVVRTPTLDHHEKQLERDLRKNEETVSRGELETTVQVIHERIDSLSATYRTLARSSLFRLLFGRRIARSIDELQAFSAVRSPKR